ncbi:Transposon TX1 uncharacterized protein [Chionoecetes opilio]|uniref:Transposon TX1 uncharacterized protein n=1 Tax=Chionoecetes opilio TaxID=41210 RepID=A0A8J8WMF6_CHIOP|nr:Transposon TX1 uncharacterized protein [Chionoecetes opilio]
MGIKLKSLSLQEKLKVLARMDAVTPDIDAMGSLSVDVKGSGRLSADVDGCGSFSGSVSLHYSTFLKHIFSLTTVLFFRRRFGKELSLEERMEFVNLWYLLICINDILIIFGSFLKIGLETLRVLVERRSEFRQGMLAAYVDLKKAFDSVHLIFAESLEVLVMALEALHEEAKPLGLEVSWLKTKVQLLMVDPPAEQLHTTGLQAVDADPPIDETAPSLDEVREAVAKLRGGKAAGVCNISAELLKAGGEAMIHGLHAVLTAVWQSGTIPPDWKRGLVVPIWKGKGDRQDCNNYRGITLLSVPGKVLAHLLLTRICSHLVKHQRPQQSGFKPGRSTTDRILALRVLVERRREFRQGMLAAYVDLKKAFDSVHLIFAESLEVLVMALEALHEEAKPLGLEVSWLKTKVQVFGDLLDEAVQPPSFLSWEILYRGNSPTVAEVKMELFRSHCYSIYCNSLWSRYKVATMNRFKVCHNDILKRLLGLPRWYSSSLAFARSGVNNLDVIRRHSVFSLRSRVEFCTNSIITPVRQSSAYVCGPIQQRWLGLLFVQNVG